jgi:Tol biopolymer transport system component
VEIFKMKADGSNELRLTDASAFDDNPEFSPNGNKIVFNRFTGTSKEIFVMRANGTHQHQVTNNSVPDQFPDWGVRP